MVKRLSQRVVVPLSRVRFPLATPPTSDLARGRILVIRLVGVGYSCMNRGQKSVFIVFILLGGGFVLMLALRQFGVPVGFPIFQQAGLAGTKYSDFEACESSTSTEKILVGIACHEDACDYEYFGQDGARRGLSGGNGSWTDEMAEKAKYVKNCHITTPEYFTRYVGR